MTVSKALYNYIEAAIEDYFAEGYRSISTHQLVIIADNLLVENEFVNLSGKEIGQAVYQVAQEVIAK